MASNASLATETNVCATSSSLALRSEHARDILQDAHPLLGRLRQASCVEQIRFVPAALRRIEQRAADESVLIAQGRVDEHRETGAVGGDDCHGHFADRSVKVQDLREAGLEEELAARIQECRERLADDLGASIARPREERLVRLDDLTVDRCRDQAAGGMGEPRG